MSFGFNFPALFRAHNTTLQTGIGSGGPFNLQFSEGCEIIGGSRVNIQNNAYLYGDIKIDGSTGNNQSYDIAFDPTKLISTMISEGWQIASEINLTIMVGDDGVYNVAQDNVALTVRQISGSNPGNSSADQTRVFGLRVEVTP
tara:strand:- start:223 stop:651 length:429 start_codon:yes stop_codon:yes gene_type:complete